MRKLIVALAVAVASLTLTGPAFATTEHCPSGGTKVEAQGDELNGIVLAAGTQFCVKGSTDATGILTADGETSLVTYLGNGHDVSYYVVYEVEPTEPPPTEPPPTEPPPTEPPPTEPPPPGDEWTPSWTPSDVGQVPVGETPPGDLAHTGISGWVIVAAGALTALGLSALALARRMSHRE